MYVAKLASPKRKKSLYWVPSWNRKPLWLYTEMDLHNSNPSIRFKQDFWPMIINYFGYDKVLVAKKHETNTFLRSFSTVFFLQSEYAYVVAVV